MKYANWYTQGQRPVIYSDKSLLRFTLSTLIPPAKGIMLGDSVLIKVNETDALTNLTSDFVTSPYSFAEVGSTLQISGNTKNNFSTPIQFKVTAKDNSSKTYTIIAQKPSNSKEITAFSFQNLTPVVNGVFKNDTIYLLVPGNTDVTDLVATFTSSAFAKVTVNGVIQKSGITVNDYFDPLTYKVTAYDSTTRNYTVVVKRNTGIDEVSEIHPDLFPNPVQEKLYTGLHGTTSYRIMTTDGRMVMQGNTAGDGIVVEQLPSGMYFIQLMQNDKQFTSKFLRL
jgi:hypothetical protein